MLFKVDHNNIMGVTVEEAGTYNVTVLPTSQVTQSKSSGNDMMVLNYEVADGKYKGGQIRYHYLVWNGDTPQSIDQSIRRFNTLAVAAVIWPSQASIRTKWGDASTKQGTTAITTSTSYFTTSSTIIRCISASAAK